MSICWHFADDVRSVRDGVARIQRGSKIDGQLLSCYAVRRLDSGISNTRRRSDYSAIQILADAAERID